MTRRGERNTDPVSLKRICSAQRVLVLFEHLVDVTDARRIDLDRQLSFSGRGLQQRAAGASWPHRYYPFTCRSGLSLVNVRAKLSELFGRFL
jgi:hypothetical protein